jgi:hypothetical protein
MLETLENKNPDWVDKIISEINDYDEAKKPHLNKTNEDSNKAL